jgi:hypothetical protein
MTTSSCLLTLEVADKHLPFAGGSLKTVPVNPKLGKYDAPIKFPIIPVAAAALPNGKVGCTTPLLHHCLCKSSAITFSQYVTFSHLPTAGWW